MVGMQNRRARQPLEGFAPALIPTAHEPTLREPLADRNNGMMTNCFATGHRTLLGHHPPTVFSPPHQTCLTAPLVADAALTGLGIGDRGVES